MLIWKRWLEELLKGIPPPKSSIGNLFRILSEQEEPLTRQQIAKLADVSVHTIEPDLFALINNLQLVRKIGKGKVSTYELTQRAKENKRQLQPILNKLGARPTREQLAKAVERIKKIINKERPAAKDEVREIIRADTPKIVASRNADKKKNKPNVDRREGR